MRLTASVVAAVLQVGCVSPPPPAPAPPPVGVHVAWPSKPPHKKPGATPSRLPATGGEVTQEPLPEPEPAGNATPLPTENENEPTKP
jgi:hypothetical protein